LKIDQKQIKNYFMKKNVVIILIIVAALVLWGVSMYNSLVSSEEAVLSQWSNVENQYQRRADLIPNLVATVKGYAAHERGTLEEVVQARAKATQITVDANSLTPEKLQQFQQAQGELSAALGRLLMIAENYPDLKANQNFIELQAQLEGTENRIAVERNRFNEMARNYNASIRRFPKSIIATLFGFEKKPYFEAEAGTEKAPKVEF
jgi:LemA protein